MERARDLLGKPYEIAANVNRIAAVQPPGAPRSRKVVGRSGGEYILLDLERFWPFKRMENWSGLSQVSNVWWPRRPLRAIEERLAEPQFQRVHRNAIVNVNHVRKMSALSSQRWLVTLSNSCNWWSASGRPTISVIFFAGNNGPTSVRSRVFPVRSREIHSRLSESYRLHDHGPPILKLMKRILRTARVVALSLCAARPAMLNRAAATPEPFAARCSIPPARRSRARRWKFKTRFRTTSQNAQTDGDQGNFEFENVPFNNYHLSVTAPGFQTAHAGRGRSLVRFRSKLK